MKKQINKYIIVDEEICHGKPIFKGTRIMVYLVLEMLKQGLTLKEILDIYQSLTKEHILAALDLSIDLVKDKNKLINN